MLKITRCVENVLDRGAWSKLGRTEAPLVVLSRFRESNAVYEFVHMRITQMRRKTT
jgi:hypothetical protein